MRIHTSLLFFGLCLVAGCGGTSAPAFNDDAATGTDAAQQTDSGVSSEDAPLADTSTPADDTGVSVDDVGAPADAPTPPPPGDGGVVPASCVPKTALASDLPHDVEGALEGDLVAIHCPGDADHLHLQVAVGTKRYDIAIPVYDSMGGAPIGILTKDIPAGSAAPGWSNATFSYTSNLGVHSTDFTMLDKAGMLAKLQSELQYTHVSIHGKSYTDGTGVHDVHYKDGSHDGVILLRGRGAGGKDHAIAVRYSTATF